MGGGGEGMMAMGLDGPFVLGGESKVDPPGRGRTTQQGGKSVTKGSTGVQDEVTQLTGPTRRLGSGGDAGELRMDVLMSRWADAPMWLQGARCK